MHYFRRGTTGTHSTFATIFKEEAGGKKINHVVDKHLAPLRNEIAHPLLETGELAVSIDDLKHMRKINQWLPLTRCIVRRLLQERLPRSVFDIPE
jgi:hypothetical protein